MINFFHSADCYINCVIITCFCFLTALKYRLWILGPRIKKPCSQYRYYKTWFVDPLSTITVLLSLSTTFVFLWKHNPRPTMKFTANFYYPADSNFWATVHCKYVGHRNYSCILSSVYHSSFTTHPNIYIL